MVEVFGDRESVRGACVVGGGGGYQNIGGAREVLLVCAGMCSGACYGSILRSQ